MSRSVCHSSRSIADQNDTPPDLAVARLAAKQLGVISIGELRACGLDDDAVASRVRRGHLHRLHRGVYAVGCAGVTVDARFLAAVKACGPRAALSHASAAAYQSFMRWDAWRLPEVTVTGCARRVHGVRVHRSRVLNSKDVLRIGAIAVTSPSRTLLDLGAVLPEPALRRVARRAQASGLSRDANCSRSPCAAAGTRDLARCARCSPMGRRRLAVSWRTSCSTCLTAANCLVPRSTSPCA